MSAYSSWIRADLMPPVTRWLQVERVPFEARALQARARRALSIGEVDEHVCAFVTMHTGSVMRICWATGAGASTSAWVSPDGKVEPVPYGGHWEWIKANAQRLAAEGLAPQDAATLSPAQVGMKMMQQGWIRYSGGVVMTFPMPSEAQMAALDGLVRESGAPEDMTVQFFIEGAGVRGEVPARDVAAKGVAAVVAELSQGEQPLGERVADMGGASDGPFQQGDGQDVQNSYMEQLQDGSTAPIERSYQYMPQDFLPETWWAQQLLRYKEKSYPGKPSVGPQSDLPASGTGPGQQFASAVRTVLVAAEEGARRRSTILREAGVGDPSDTDGQHDLVNEDSMQTHLLDPDNQLYKGDKGRGPITQELKTHLGHRWFNRKSDKAVEQQIITMEKDHLEPGEIKQELRQEGIPASVIDETYQNRDKNLLKVVEVSL